MCELERAWSKERKLHRVKENYCGMVRCMGGPLLKQRGAPECLGGIFLNLRHAGAGTLAHEAYHAALQLYTRLGYPLREIDNRREELMADLVGEICRKTNLLGLRAGKL